MYVAYSALLALVLLLGTPYWLLEMLRHGKYRRGLFERLGSVPPRLANSRRPSIWIHAVSVGEVLAVSELVRSLKGEFPEHRVVVSTTTDTGQKLACSRFGAESVFYFPLDFAFSARPYFAALRPDLIVIAETEFWPNLLRISRESGAPAAVVNARISDRSLPGYRRWRTILRPVLRDISLFVAQTAEDARRLTEIGASPDRVFVGGNLKFDVALPAVTPIVEQLKSALTKFGAGPVLVCGSTVDGEELMLLESFKDVLAHHPSAVMLLAPRHPERFAQVESLLLGSKIQFCRRSEWLGQSLRGSVLLLDSIGELSGLYALADLAFVGGSLVPRGGHNILEPAQQGVPVLVGPYTENFRDIVSLFLGRDAVRVVGPDELSGAVIRLLANNSERHALSRRALETLGSQRGATRFTLEKLKALLPAPTREAHLA